MKNLGSEVEIIAVGEHFSEFVEIIRHGPPMARIDSITVEDYRGDIPDGFVILPSSEGSLSGMIPPDLATCDECIADIGQAGGRYHDYWCTSCVNCGPRYSIIRTLPYDRERTSMSSFTMCPACEAEYGDPVCRRHHAQTIACITCGPRLRLLDTKGNYVDCSDPVRETAGLLDNGSIIAIKGIGGFHFACIEESAHELKRRLGRTEQPLAVMVRPGMSTVSQTFQQATGSCSRAASGRL